MIPSIQIEESRFTEVAGRVVEREIGEGIRLAQACILEEVLAEGSANQKQEAQRLLESIR